MKTPATLLWSSQILIAALSLNPFSAAQGAPSQIKAEIARIRESVKTAPIKDENLKEINSTVEEGLKNASAALDAGNLYLSLELIGRAEDLLRGGQRADNNAEIKKNGLPAFETEWGKVSLRLTALDKESRERNWGNA